MAMYIILIVSAVALYLLQKILHYLKLRRLQSLGNCQDPTFWPQKARGDGSDFSGVYMAQRLPGGNYIKWINEQFTLCNNRTFVVKVHKEPWLFTSDPANLKAINAANPRDHLFDVGPMRRPRIGGWIGDGIAISDGERWRSSRALFKPMFARAEIGNLHYFEARCMRMLDTLPDDGESFDLQPLLKHLYLDFSTELFFGRSANSLGPGEASFDIPKFDSAFERAMMGMVRKIAFRTRLGFSTTEDKEWSQACKEVHDVFDANINLTLDRMKDTAADDHKRINMVAELSKASDNRLFIRDQLLNVFIGAKDTGGIGISNVFFHLARHPRVWEKLRQEILTIPAGQNLTFEYLKSLKYLQCVLSESLRLLSPVIISIRTAMNDTVLPTGGGKTGCDPILVRKGTRVESDLAGLHYDPAIWGKDAAEFIPERFERGRNQNSEESAVGSSKWEYIPFLGGPRMCPAQQMMLTQYALVLVRFMQRFERLDNRDSEWEFVPQIVFSMQSRNGVQIAAFRDKRRQ